MALQTSITFLAAAGLFASAEAGLYPKTSAVLSITGKTYQSLIANSNQTSIVEFYAPWCGHCKNLQPAYEKAAKSLAGIAKVAAVDCDDEANKPFCGSMGVQGFPTLKIVKPGKKPGKPIVEDYQGARSAKAIVDAVKEKIPNHVKKLTDKDAESWISQPGAKAILFTDKGTTSATLKSLAIDFLGSVAIAQVRDKETATVEKYKIKKFPSLTVFSTDGSEPITYLAEMKKDAMSKFIQDTTSISPNPDPAPESAKKAKPSKADKKQEKKFAQFEQSSKSHKSADASSEKLKATSIKLETEPTESPDPKVDAAKPVKLAEQVKVLDVLETADDVHAKCLNPSAKVCILALLPDEYTPGQQAVTPDSPARAILSLSEVRHKLSGRGLFPFYAISPKNPIASDIRSELSLGAADKFAVIATNAKRSWVRKYSGSTYGVPELEEWVDAIKMNEGAKDKLPEKLVKEVEVPKPTEKVEEIKVRADGEKHVFMDGDVMVEMEEVDDDFVMPPPPAAASESPRDEL